MVAGRYLIQTRIKNCSIPLQSFWIKITSNWLGSWAQWRPQILLPYKMSKVVEPSTGREQTCEVWSTQIKLPDNVDQVYRYKFIVDGDWVYDSSQPTVANDHGSFDNYFVVSITKKLARRNYLLFFKESMRLGWTSSSFVHYSYTFTTTSSKEKKWLHSYRGKFGPTYTTKRCYSFLLSFTFICPLALLRSFNTTPHSSFRSDRRRKSWGPSLKQHLTKWQR